MTIRNLSAIFEPRSVVLVGASNREGSVGYWLARNLIGGGFEGAVHFVNPKGGEVAGQRCLTSVGELPDNVDLAVIATPALSLIHISEPTRPTRASRMPSSA